MKVCEIISHYSIFMEDDEGDEEMNIIVIYKSKTGFTEKYAEWIAEELGCTTMPYEGLSTISISECDMVIFGSRTHAGKIDDLKKFKKHFTETSTPKLIVFATGATPANAEDLINEMWKNNFSEEELLAIPHFYMQSGLNYEKMGMGDRMIMKMFAKMMSGKKEKSEEEAEMGEAIQESYDISSKECIVPLVNFVKEQEEKLK